MNGRNPMKEIHDFLEKHKGQETIELCPMCKKHPAIIEKYKETATVRNIPVEYEQIVYFCSTLGEDDLDCYFIPSKVMDENLKRIREAYERKISNDRT